MERTRNGIPMTKKQIADENSYLKRKKEILEKKAEIVRCDVCKLEMRRGSLGAHCKTIKHLSNIKPEVPPIPELPYGLTIENYQILLKNGIKPLIK